MSDRRCPTTPSCTACRTSVSSAAPRVARGAVRTRASSRATAALAITDECSLAGIVRALEASRSNRRAADRRQRDARSTTARSWCCWCETAAGYAALCRLITVGPAARRQGRVPAAARGLRRARPTGCWRCGCPTTRAPTGRGGWLQSSVRRTRCGSRSNCIAARTTTRACRRCASSAHACACRWSPAATCTCTCVRAGALQDTMTAIRHRTTRGRGRGTAVPQRRAPPAHAPRAGGDLSAPTCWPKRCASPSAARFDLRQLRYDYPRELVPAGQTPASWLRHLTEEGARWRWPEGVPDEGARRRSSTSWR